MTIVGQQEDIHANHLIKPFIPLYYYKYSESISSKSIGDTVTQCTAHERGIANAVTVGQNHFFLENKVVINFDFRHGAKKSGQSGHPFRSYGYL